MGRATESPEVIKAIADLACTHVNDGDQHFLPKPNVVETFRGAVFELSKRMDLPQSDRMRLQMDTAGITSQLLRAVAIKSKDKDMKAVLHAEKGLEAITGPRFLEMTRELKMLLGKSENNFSPAGTYSSLRAQLVEVEQAYMATVGKVLKEQQGIDVLAQLEASDRIGQDGGMQLTGGRISDPRTPPAATWATPK